MFVCQKCEKVVGPRVRPVKLIVETRDAVYPHRPKVFKVRTGDSKSRWRDDSGGNGLEIVKEVDACAECAEASQPVDAAAAE